MIGNLETPEDIYMYKQTDHEVRIRLLENLEQKMTDRFNRIEEKMDNQFYWIMGTILTIFGGVVLHLANLV